MHYVCKDFGIEVCGGCSDVISANYIRVVCDAGLQIMFDFVVQLCAYALALDVLTHQAMSYLDVSLRFTENASLYNIHLLTTPMFERHTAETMSNLLSRVLDAISSQWK